MSKIIRISFAELKSVFNETLISSGFAPEAAETCAEVFARNSLDGVYSHGVTRFPKFIRHLRDGHIRADQKAARINGFGSMEQWDGNAGPGPVNAILATQRAMDLASESGMGCVAMANTNHWLRGGTYGWKAAKAGFIFIGWSNTIANMPVWGGADPRLGNNPLVMAVPYRDEAIVLDMAMSQYSYGALEMYDRKGQELPVPGGYDGNGALTTSPGDIRKSQRPLPIGYWKGSGLSLLLDVVGTMLSGGLSTSAITKQKGEYNLSQVFIVIDLKKAGNYEAAARAVENIIMDYHQSVPLVSGKPVRYPGENILVTRAENTQNGIPVLEDVWHEIQNL